MKRAPLVLFAVLWTALVARAEAPSLTAPAAAGMDAAKLAEIPKRMQEFADKNRISGAVTLVARHGKIVALDAVGLADIDAKRAMTGDTLFWIASMTKPITAAAFMILVDEGKVSPDELVEKYVPEFKDVKHKDGTSPAKPLTIKQLLTHTSGVADPPAASRAGVGLAEWSVIIAKQPLLFEPGSKWQYGGGTNISVVGRIIEIVSGKRFDVFLSERIFEPLGMKDTGFYPSADQRKRLARIYRPGKTPGSLEATGAPFINSEEKDKARPPNPSGGLFASAADLATFHHMVLAGGEVNGKRILSKKAVEAMTSVQTGDLTAGLAPGMGWGLGWSVVKQPAGGAKMLSTGSHGHGGAFGTQAWIDPKKGLVLVFLIQRTGFTGADGPDMRGAFQELAASAVKDGSTTRPGK